jgi:hypothetical protein
MDNITCLIFCCAYHESDQSSFIYITLYYSNSGTQWRRWLRRYARSLNVAVSSPDQVIELLQFTASFQQHYVSGADLIPNRNGYQMIFLGSRQWPTREADNLTASCELIV